VRGDGRLYQRPGSPFWWAAYYLRGKQYHQSTGETDEKRALKFLKAKIKEVGADQLGARPFITPQHERITVNEILDDVMEHYKRGGRRGIPRQVSPQMQSHLKRLRDYFGSCKAMSVGTRDVEAFISQLKEEKKANGTVNRSLQLLSQAYRYAVTTDPPKLSRALKIETLDESDNVRKGKFTPVEAELIFHSLPPYMTDVARFAYETGSRAGEILKLRWTYFDGDAIRVPGNITKNRKERTISLTPELLEIIDRRRETAVCDCDLVFHHDGQPISDYRKCWHTACVTNGLGTYYCRNCRDSEGRYTSVLDADRKCSLCQHKCDSPKYIGRLFHDFRRSAAHEMWKAGSSADDCMKVTGHKTESMFKRYADLISEEEIRARQREVQKRRSEWRKMQATNVLVMPKTAVQ
jgi:integrase